MRTYNLANSAGIKMNVISYGGIITSLIVPDKNGNPTDIVLGCNSIDAYKQNTSYLGAIIGRFANRIGNAKFSLNGIEYQLAKNDNGKHHLHGGTRGFDKKKWQIDNYSQNKITLSYISKDGEENYPGTLNVQVSYSLTEDNELVIEYAAGADKPTICNLTQHIYFNLNGHDSGDILNHKIMINADNFTPTNADSIPTGEIRPVVNSNFDFKTLSKIGARINKNDEQLIFAGGYDHNYCLNKATRNELSHAATILSDKSGIVMDVFTTEPGMQFYTGNYLDGSIVGKSGVKYIRRSGFCLETQHFPDSPNHSGFPSTIINPGNKYLSKTVYTFRCRRLTLL